MRENVEDEDDDLYELIAGLGSGGAPDPWLEERRDPWQKDERRSPASCSLSAGVIPVSSPLPSKESLPAEALLTPEQFKECVGKQKSASSSCSMSPMTELTSPSGSTAIPIPSSWEGGTLSGGEAGMAEPDDVRALRQKPCLTIQPPEDRRVYSGSAPKY